MAMTVKFSTSYLREEYNHTMKSHKRVGEDWCLTRLQTVIFFTQNHSWEARSVKSADPACKPHTPYRKIILSLPSHSLFSCPLDQRIKWTGEGMISQSINNFIDISRNIVKSKSKDLSRSIPSYVEKPFIIANLLFVMKIKITIKGINNNNY